MTAAKLFTFLALPSETTVSVAEDARREGLYLVADQAIRGWHTFPHETHIAVLRARIRWARENPWSPWGRVIVGLAWRAYRASKRQAVHVRL